MQKSPPPKIWAICAISRKGDSSGSYRPDAKIAQIVQILGGAGYRVRTDDLLLGKQTLYQLS